MISPDAGFAKSLGECDYCGLRYGHGRIADCVACSVCLESRTVRVKACHERLTRQADHVVPEEIGGTETVDLFDEELE